MQPAGRIIFPIHIARRLRAVAWSAERTLSALYKTNITWFIRCQSYSDWASRGALVNASPAAAGASRKVEIYEVELRRS